MKDVKLADDYGDWDVLDEIERESSGGDVEANLVSSDESEDENDMFRLGSQVYQVISETNGEIERDDRVTTEDQEATEAGENKIVDENVEEQTGNGVETGRNGEG